MKYYRSTANCSINVEGDIFEREGISQLKIFLVLMVHYRAPFVVSFWRPHARSQSMLHDCELYTGKKDRTR